MFKGLVAAAVSALLFAVLPISGWAAVEYYHLDALGSVRAVTDQTGAVVERHDYLPFGEECTTGACASNPGAGAGRPKKFTGKERDSETGLDYFEARYYTAWLGRFSTTDPLALSNGTPDPQRWNRYAYCRNNPLNRIDSDGRQESMAYGAQILNNPVAHEGYSHGVEIAVKSLLNVLTSVFLQEGHGAPQRRLFEPVNQNERLLMDIGETMFTFGFVSNASGRRPSPGNGPGAESTRVGRWMSTGEYEAMVATGKVQEGAGGVTYAATSGPASFRAQAKPGSIYVEYDVPSNSLVRGSKSDWVRNVGPGAAASTKRMLEKQGGEQLPAVKNVSKPLEKKQ